MAVRAESEQNEVEGCPPELTVVVRRRGGGVVLAADPMLGSWLRRQPVEEGLLRKTEVRPLVVRGHAALGAPPHPGAAPVGLELRRPLVRPAGGRAARAGDPP